MLPAHAAPVPVALIIAGSGPTDRDGNAPGLQLNMYRKLAAALADGGIASVRYDKRGIAASRASGPAEADLRFETFADDAAAWIAKLRSDGRFSHVAIIGHSEGSLLGMLAAQRQHCDAYVSLEGAGFPIATVLRAQLRPQLQPYPALAAQAEKILTALSNGTLVDGGDVPAGLQALYRPSIQPYIISWLKYDPRIEIAKVTGRVTIVQGSHDVQVPVEDGKALAGAQPSAAFALIDAMTHVLTDDPGTTLGEQLPGAYADAARPLDVNLIRTLISAVRVPG
jgi:pimeloyl-ACP methyl ester carboxylesterase